MIDVLDWGPSTNNFGVVLTGTRIPWERTQLQIQFHQAYQIDVRDKVVFNKFPRGRGKIEIERI